MASPISSARWFGSCRARHSERFIRYRDKSCMPYQDAISRLHEALARRSARSLLARIVESIGIALPGSMGALLAYRNLRRAGGRMIVSLFGIFFATFLMAVQGSLLYGFSIAASRIVDAVDADIWMIAKGTPATEFVTPIPERYADLALGVEGVFTTGRAVASWAPFEKTKGDHTFIFIAGVEDSFRGRIPNMASVSAAAGVSDGGLLFDETDTSALGADPQERHVEVAGLRAHLLTTISGFSTFLGPPLVFGSYIDVRRYLRYDRTKVGIVFARISKGVDAGSVRNNLRVRFPDLDCWTASEFSTRSRVYWLLQTGAGAALSLAAFLGFSLGLVLVAQTMYALTTENIEEFATLRALGASDRDLYSIVLAQSLICGVVGCTSGLIAVGPFVALARSNITWVSVPAWMYGLIPILVLTLCICAARIAVKPAMLIEPGRVFRA
jgi:putative ABC transport system permease protein